jgi:predicted phosphodiesterase
MTTTALVSDLHLGTTVGADIVRRPEVRSRLAGALSRADHVVFLGDLIELRELPLREVLEAAGPALRELAVPLAGKRVTLVAGNHDHRLIEPWLDGFRLDGGGPALDWSAEPEGLAAEIARLLPDSELRVAYPGVRVREDVYAMHGHYVDLHMGVPRVESVLGHALARAMLGRDGRVSGTADYERVLGPIYSLSYGMAQGAGGRGAQRHNHISRGLWERASADNRSGSPVGFVLGRLAVPAAVGALNLAGLGPFTAELSAERLRSEGLRAMREVVDTLGLEADHVIFGHTHRMGPLEGDDPGSGWTLPGGTRLWNTGSWFFEKVLVGPRRQLSPYWPGGVIYLREEGPPEPVNVLRELEL